MNIEQTKIVLVPETGYKRTITLKLIKAEMCEGKWMIRHKGFVSHIVKHKQARFAIIITDVNGLPAREIKYQFHIHESRGEILKDYNDVVAYYKAMAFKEQNPGPKPLNGVEYNGLKYEWPTHPWDK